jgi:KDO2-lipid IV(A) lauroyltransferase
LLALKTGARIVSGIIVRKPDHTYDGFATSDFDVELTGDLSADVKLLTQRIMDTMEAFIRQYPEQWFIFRPMWPKDAS